MADDLVPLRLCPLSCALWSATQKRSGWPGTEPGQPAVGLCDDMEHMEHLEDPFDVEQKIREEMAEETRDEAEVEQAREAEEAEEYGEGAAAGPDAVMEVPSSATTVAAAQPAQVDLKTVQSLAADTGPIPGASTKPHLAATKRPREPRMSAADLMETAEQLWSAKTRGLLEFEEIAPINGLPMGAIGVAVGQKGAAAFYSYLKNAKVIARLESEGFETSRGPTRGRRTPGTSLGSRA